MTEEEIHEAVYGMGRAARQAAYALAVLDAEAVKVKKAKEKARKVRDVVVARCRSVRRKSVHSPKIRIGAMQGLSRLWHL